jgi:hypothetical protein
MKRQRSPIVTMETLVLSGLLLAGCGNADTPIDAQKGPTDLPSVTQNRDIALPATQRFVILPAFSNDAVLDKETDLVWEKSPQTTSARWTEARRMCSEKNVGGQKGWRLPSLEELQSLVDPSVAPDCPVGCLLVIDEGWRGSQGRVGRASWFRRRRDLYQLGPQRPSLVCS